MEATGYYWPSMGIFFNVEALKTSMDGSSSSRGSFEGFRIWTQTTAFMFFREQQAVAEVAEQQVIVVLSPTCKHHSQTLTHLHESTHKANVILHSILALLFRPSTGSSIVAPKLSESTGGWIIGRRPQQLTAAKPDNRLLTGARFNGCHFSLLALLVYWLGSATASFSSSQIPLAEPLIEQSRFKAS